MTGGEIAMRLGWRSAAVSGNADRLVKAEVLVATKLSRSLVQYSIGTTPVVER
jgi:DNA-binding MarR family transcriptional regulator